MKVEARTMGLAAAGVIEFERLDPSANIPVAQHELLRLKQHIESEWPKAKIKVDAPADPENGVWYLDLTLRGRTHVIGWQKGKPFGFAQGAISHDYGDGWPETFHTANALLARLARL